MKKLLLIVILLCVVIASNSYNYPTITIGNDKSAYNRKTLEVMYDSKNRPHKIVIYRGQYNNYGQHTSIAAIGLDAGTYINK